MALSKTRKLKAQADYILWVNTMNLTLCISGYWFGKELTSVQHSGVSLSVKPYSVNLIPTDYRKFCMCLRSEFA